MYYVYTDNIFKNLTNPTDGNMVLLDHRFDMVTQRAGNTEIHNRGPSHLGIILILGSLLFLAMHAIGPNPIPFIAPGDLFDHEPKAAASSLSASVTWIGMLVVALTFPLCQRYLREFMVVPFIIVILFQVVPFYFYFPETKGKSNSVIASMFQVDQPWRTAIGLNTSKTNYSSNQVNYNKDSLHNSSIETLSMKTVYTEVGTIYRNMSYEA